MQKNDKIYVAGHRGMAGSSIVRLLKAQGYSNIVTRTRGDLDLTDGQAVSDFFAAQQIDYVFLAAAKVGGILANSEYGGDFIRENLLIQTHVIDSAYRNGVKKFLFLGSSCIYPKLAAQPIQEDSLLTGPLEPTNFAYAVAKIAGHTMCEAYRDQFGFDAFTVMPSNVYGVNDNFDPESSHVIAGLMQRIHKAKLAGTPVIEAWGTGSPLRELLDTDDLASACLHLMNTFEGGGLINVGSSQEISIKGLVEMLVDIIGYQGSVEWDASKPDGTPRKIMDSSRLFATGWKPTSSIRSGLEKMYMWYERTGGTREY